MDHNTLPKPQFELPTPPAKPGQEALAPLEGSQDLAVPTELRNTEMPAAPAPVSPLQAAQSVAAVNQTGVANTIPLAAPATPVVADDDAVAEDGELIERVWIDKAKAIVGQTRSDPHRQNAEINKVKKEYIQKRYHKDVKLNEE